MVKVKFQMGTSLFLNRRLGVWLKNREPKISSPGNRRCKETRRQFQPTPSSARTRLEVVIALRFPADGITFTDEDKTHVIGQLCLGAVSYKDIKDAK